MKSINKAIIFDMDGVLIDSETTWRKAEDRFLKDLCGEEKYWEIRPNLIGATPEQIYDSVLGIDITLSRELFSNAYNKEVKNVYNDSKLTPGIKPLLNFLEKKNLLIGLVSSSPKSWINLVLTRFGKTKRVFKTIITLSEQMALRPKPYPDGYQEAPRTSQETWARRDRHRMLARSSRLLLLCVTHYTELPAQYSFSAECTLCASPASRSHGTLLLWYRRRHCPK